MLLEVTRSLSDGAIQLDSFAPADFRGASFTGQIGWPEGGPGGDWYFRFALADASGRFWFTTPVRALDPAAAPGAAWLIPYQIGPQPLPTAWREQFDAEQTTQVWFQIWLDQSYPAQVFTVTVDWVTVGAPAFAPWSLATETLPATARTTLFGGIITSVQMADAGALSGAVEVTYSCRAYRVFTDGRTWNKDYSALEYTDRQMITEIFNATGLAPSIVRLGTIAETGVLQLNFQYQTVTQCLDAIASATGLTWSIDAMGTLVYAAPASQPVIVELSDAPGATPFRVDSYAEDFYAPANDVTFVGDGVTARVYDQTSIDKYGLMQWTDYDLRVTHADTALTAAETDLARASTPNERAEITCWTVGAIPGNVIRATAQRYGWSAKELAIQRVEMTQLGDSAATTETKLTVGDYNPTLLDGMAAVAKEIAAADAAGAPIMVNGA
jgi:hypothetical protein